jgi:hypothetical protein
MDTKIYQTYGIDTAVQLLRPGAKWEFLVAAHLLSWDDPRPKPSSGRSQKKTMEKIQAFEDSINTVWLPEQIEELTGQQRQIEEAIGG